MSDLLEQLRILSIKKRDARERMDGLGMMNASGLNEVARANLDADYAMAKIDYLRASAELEDAIRSEGAAR